MSMFVNCSFAQVLDQLYLEKNLVTLIHCKSILIFIKDLAAMYSAKWPGEGNA